MARQVRLVCAGIATVDVVFDVDEIPTRPVKVRAKGSAIFAGGCALLAAIAAARLGGRVSLAAPVGDDHFAMLVRSELADEGVATDALVTVPGVPTARSAVLIDAAGERTIINHRAEALFTARPEIGRFEADAALADTRWPAGAAALLSAAREANRPAVLDAEPPFAGTEGALEAATHVAFSEAGLHAFTGEADPYRALAQARADLGVFVCVTRGPAPVLIDSGRGVQEVPTFGVRARDTLGAGDAWHGAFALFLGEGQTEAEAARLANAVAALKASRSGGCASLPRRDELNRFLSTHSEPA